MARRALVMALAKVIIAAAWADHDLSNDEVNSLKQLLLRLRVGTGAEGHLTVSETAEVDIYLAAPVGEAERARLVQELAAQLHGPGERTLAFEALDELFRADGVITPQERAVAEEIHAALGQVDMNIFARLGRVVGGALGADKARVPRREDMIDDFLKNRIYFAVRQRLSLQPDAALGLGDAEARMLCLAGGLLAHIAAADATIAAAERSAIEQALVASWGITPTGAALVAEVALSEAARSIDVFQLTNELRTTASRELRLGFLDAAFAVAAADGKVSAEESAEISRMAQGIGLVHAEFVAAKLRVGRG
jgi:uncharacterized tellurite resistance protein B-like protein